MGVRAVGAATCTVLQLRVIRNDVINLLQDVVSVTYKLPSQCTKTVQHINSSSLRLTPESLQSLPTEDTCFSSATQIQLEADGGGGGRGGGGRGGFVGGGCGC